MEYGAAEKCRKKYLSSKEVIQKTNNPTLITMYAWLVLNAYNR